VSETTEWESPSSSAAAIGYVIQAGPRALPSFYRSSKRCSSRTLKTWAAARINSVGSMKLLTLVGLEPRPQYDFPADKESLSETGGQRQGASAVARALAADPHNPPYGRAVRRGSIPVDRRRELSGEFSAMAKRLRKTIVLSRMTSRSVLLRRASSCGTKSPDASLPMLLSESLESIITKYAPSPGLSLHLSVGDA